jgi:hypothetical protein
LRRPTSINVTPPGAEGFQCPAGAVSFRIQSDDGTFPAIKAVRPAHNNELEREYVQQYDNLTSANLNPKVLVQTSGREGP